jgi:hypothetical protein
MIRTFAAAVTITMLFCGTAQAQRSAAPAKEASAEERAAQLRAVPGLVTSPDRELNIANFEEIVGSGDALRIETAVRTLVSSDDPVMRGLAMRGYLAATRELSLDVVLPANEMKALEDARAQPNFPNNMGENYHDLRLLNSIAFKFTLTFEGLKISSNIGKVRTFKNNNHELYKTEYIVRGERITFKNYYWIDSRDRSCATELAPTKKALIVGTISCNGWVRPIQVEASMF